MNCFLFLSLSILSHTVTIYNTQHPPHNIHHRTLTTHLTHCDLSFLISTFVFLRSSFFVLILNFIVRSYQYVHSVNEFFNLWFISISNYVLLWILDLESRKFRWKYDRINKHTANSWQKKIKLKKIKFGEFYYCNSDCYKIIFYPFFFQFCLNFIFLYLCSIIFLILCFQ